MGLFSKKPKLDNYLVDANENVEKFTVDGKTYDLERYVKFREADLRMEFEGNPVKIGKNQDKTKKAWLKDKTDVIAYIEFAIAKQLAEGAEKCRVSAVDVKNNTQ